MEYFLETSHLDAATADMLKKYDRDGNGSFSKEEVVAIILDLREAMQSNEMLGASNKFFRRMLIGVSVFALLLLTSMFGLSYAVAALTAKLDVSSDGTMTTTDGKTNVATESSAYKIVPEKIEGTDYYCISNAERNALMTQAMSGRTNVLMQFDAVNETQKIVQQISGGQVTTDGTKTCFSNAQGKEICVEQSTDCAPKNRRRLDVSACVALAVNNPSFYEEYNYDCPATVTCEAAYVNGEFVYTQAGAECYCRECEASGGKAGPS